MSKVVANERRGLSARQRLTLRLARLAHVYSSMIALTIVLFFGVTGLTLNHPTWTFGDDVNTVEINGNLPFSPLLADGKIDFLKISEFARNELGANGAVESYEFTGSTGSISYKRSGYTGDLTFDTSQLSYSWVAEQYGWVAVINDLHKGRHSGTTWRWLIDISAIFLVLISLTGLLMQFYLRRRKMSALTTAFVGTVVLCILICVTLL